MKPRDATPVRIMALASVIDEALNPIGSGVCASRWSSGTMKPPAPTV